MDEETRAEIRELWKREWMRNWISILLIISLVAGFRLLAMLSCVLWIAYLAYCIRQAEDRGVRITNWIVMILPIGFIIYNLVLLIKG